VAIPYFLLAPLRNDATIPPMAPPSAPCHPVFSFWIVVDWPNASLPV
jgi:hypothetical protein